MSFDEFKYASGRMAFEYINVEDGNIDILPLKIVDMSHNIFYLVIVLIKEVMYKQ